VTELIVVEMVRNDLNPSIEATLTRKDGSIVDLTGCTVKFHMKKGETLLVNKPATILTPPTDGKVRFDWTSGDTDIVGLCKAEFEITFTDGKPFTFPAKDEFYIIFREELG